jgi:hypothetical protein
MIKLTKKGSVTEIMIMLVLIVITSAVILLLVNYGVLDVKADSNEQVLNTEFLPMEENKIFTINDLKLCQFIDPNNVCINPTTEFDKGTALFVAFNLESSPYNNQIEVLRNYRIIGPGDKVVLDIIEENNEIKTIESNVVKEMFFGNYFMINDDFVSGDYTLEIYVKNDLINKQLVRRKSFVIK